MEYNYITEVELTGKEIKALRKAIVFKQVELEDLDLKDTDLYTTLDKVYEKLINASL